MKKILAGVAALSAALVLTACSGGASGANSAGGGPAAGAGGGAPTATTSAAPVTTSSSPAPVTTSPPTTSTTPKPTTPKPAPKVVPAANDSGVPCAAAAASSGTAACVDLSAHKAWILEAGKVVYGPVPMLPGRKGNATPTGTFHVIGKEKLHLSKQFDDAPMPNSVFFYPGDAFHTGSLKVYSHGCIHLSAAASSKFFSTLSMGDVVQVVP
ncbi:L,D-transpeptidase [Amycolatopsis sp. H20-H5]|uniref:L,D-transpeptidase n=1 Tax=Amycolatopsis sp. H20-H5 TaxID=3046309 RepID=UPI002DBA91CC|nr:L,D-transpeptidase [Amycolatopsis sp. H20-H5]MEC3975164.1 L,D-transpeptidase [Amycolatopsis sp. H20-H5]